LHLQSKTRATPQGGLCPSEGLLAARKTRATPQGGLCPSEGLLAARDVNPVNPI
jgi:hypothetical protein